MAKSKKRQVDLSIYRRAPGREASTLADVHRAITTNKTVKKYNDEVGHLLPHVPANATN